MPDFTIFPAIDLRGGKVVRLAEGDPYRQTSYNNDPLDWAKRWKSEGAKWLHVINLDGAFDVDTHQNMLALESILTAGLAVEFGGGLRDQASITAALAMGVSRIFLGTAAFQEPALTTWAVDRYGPERIAGDIGVRDGKVSIKGWQETIPLSLVDAGQQLKEIGLTRCVLTDVKRDGLGSGVNVSQAVELQEASGLQVVASGGVWDIEDVIHVREAGLAGVIIGRALYEGTIKLKDCVKIQDGE
jgi:phosphoribosylformimino-5-aminoimidazole carboxamide ribotide isomerase